MAAQPSAYAERTLGKAGSVEVRPLKVSLLKRLKLIAIFFAVGFLSTVAGVLSSVDPSEAQMIVRETENLRDTILNTPGIGVAAIFGNNLMHCLLMFVPVLGLIQGVYVLYSTGRVLAALGMLYGSDPLHLMLVMMVFPHAVMEYVAYSIALSESFWLTYVTARGGLKAARRELNDAAKMIVVSTVILLLAAVVEMVILLQT
ncbi:MAG: hypothetical protein AYL32_005910 [Candidatus Bathyarchaeota archaeon B26-2]|nr:MAG: hypothetical protein AYL32_005910 [Candidatus Bathyarchaeota archaeon B26-2]